MDRRKDRQIGESDFIGRCPTNVRGLKIFQKSQLFIIPLLTPLQTTFVFQTSLFMETLLQRLLFSIRKHLINISIFFEVRKAQIFLLQLLLMSIFYSY